MREKAKAVDPASFGAKLQHEREKTGMRQADVAAELGLAPNSISYYENGRSLPSLDLARRMADLFHVSLDYLLGRTEEATLSEMTSRSVAELLVRLSQLEGTRVEVDLQAGTSSLVFKDNDLAFFLREYRYTMEFLAGKPASGSDKATKIEQNRYVSGILDEVPERPIAEQTMDQQTMLDIYRR